MPEAYLEDEIAASREELAELKRGPFPIQMALEATTDPALKAVVRSQEWMERQERSHHIQRLSLGLGLAAAEAEAQGN